MAEGSVNVTEGSGKRLHTWDRTVGGVLVQSQGVFMDEYPYPSYVALGSSVSVATNGDHVLQLMAGSSNYVRIRKIHYEQHTSATTAATGTVQVLRLTTAGTGGTSVTAAKFDAGDAASGATAMTLPTAKGTESTMLFQIVLIYRQAVSATTAQVDDSWEWVQSPNQKPIIIPAGTSNGIAIKTAAGIAAATADCWIEYVETPWLGG